MGLCEGNSPVTGEFPAQKASKAEMYWFDDVITNELAEELPHIWFSFYSRYTMSSTQKKRVPVWSTCTKSRVNGRWQI